MEHKITGFDNYLFKLGRHYEIYEKLGAHLVSEAGENGTYSLYGRQMRHRFPLSVILMDGMSKNIR